MREFFENFLHDYVDTLKKYEFKDLICDVIVAIIYGASSS